MVDALAQTDDEGRGKLRKASVSCKQALSRGFPNGTTWAGYADPSHTEYIGM